MCYGHKRTTQANIIEGFLTEKHWSPPPPPPPPQLP